MAFRTFAPHTAVGIGFTPEQRSILRLLRRRYGVDRDLFSDRERARLQFMHWLYLSGQLEWTAPIPQVVKGGGAKE